MMFPATLGRLASFTRHVDNSIDIIAVDSRGFRPVFRSK